MKQTPEELIKQLTLKEKAGLCSGLDFWNTKPIERLDIPSVMLTDGPHGLRKQLETENQIGISISEPATCFPTLATTSCSFDRELLEEIGAAIGEEMLHQGVCVVLGPGLNIKRSPLCGRNFEYFSEDPLLSGELAAAMVRGIQSQGVGACVKHYAANNQETARMINDSLVDERALREIYLAGFEIAVKKGCPWTMMCSYNKINGIYACEHEHLLNEVARDDWGFDGLIMTDWGAMDDRVWALKSGLDLEMPHTGPKNDREIVDAVRSEKLDEKFVDQAGERLLALVEKYSRNTQVGKPYDLQEHDDLARRAVCESAVLLKNEAILPIEQGLSVAIIGEFAEKPRYQGAGSSKINPHKLTNALETLTAEGIPYDYAQGYDLTNQDDPKKLIQIAAQTARGKDVVVIFTGLPDEYESEGYDRTSIDLPQEHNDLIKRVSEINPNIVIVLHNGSAVRMPWIDKVKAVLLLGLGGQCVGGAAVDLLFGKANPSGKLSETYPLNLEDNPSYTQFGKRLQTEYRESIYVGYRYYEKAQKNVQFPFGHGLSYTQFEYRDLKLSKAKISDDETVNVSVNIKNIGEVFGKEVLQVYVAAPESKIFKPIKELRGFKKVALNPGEEKQVQFQLVKRAFAYWNVNLKDWQVESGTYIILIGSSSQDIRLTAEVNVQSSQGDVRIPDYKDSAPIYYQLPRGIFDIPKEQFEVIYGRNIDLVQLNNKGPFFLGSTLTDTKDTFVGKILINIFRKQIKQRFADQQDKDDSMLRLIESTVLEFPFRSFGMFGLSEQMVDGIMDLLNRKYFSGIRKVLKANKQAKMEK